MGICNSKNKCKIKQKEENIEQRWWGTTRVVNRKKIVTIILNASGLNIPIKNKDY